LNRNPKVGNFILYNKTIFRKSNKKNKVNEKCGEKRKYVAFFLMFFLARNCSSSGTWSENIA